jgi:hypothetical protein
MRSHKADDVLSEFEKRITAREATYMPWNVVWEASETPHEANGRQLQPKRSSVCCLVSCPPATLRTRCGVGGLVCGEQKRARRDFEDRPPLAMQLFFAPRSFFIHTAPLIPFFAEDMLIVG